MAQRRTALGTLKEPELKSTGRRVDRQKLGALTSLWGSDKDSIGPVGTFYYAGYPYPDKQFVVNAIIEVETLLPMAAYRLHGWGPKQVRQLRSIRSGLSYFLKRDY